MELPDLVLKDSKKSEEIRKILSGLILDEAKELGIEVESENDEVND